MRRFLFFMIISLAGISSQILAQGNLLVTPKRVIFEGNKQKAELNLMNTGTDTATYSLSFRNCNMTEKGKLELIEKPDSSQMFAEPYLRLFPRKVTLAPGEGQVVALQCRRLPGMKAGEYRSHLWFRDEKNNEPLSKMKPVLDSNQLSVSVVAIFGITIPVIIRSGEVEVHASLSDLKLETMQDSIPYLKVTINRTGNISINGKISVEYIPAKGKPYEIGFAKGMAVYTNLDHRTVAVKLNKTPGMNLKTGKLRVRYTSPEDSKFMMYAEEMMTLN
ncbi:MAG: hypothetical protein NTV01_21450 [Bacteroidia bacterium]|nr:hypothetical protein [Bacteroidia bacterium]